MRRLALMAFPLLLATAAYSAPPGDDAPRARSPIRDMGRDGMGSPMEHDLFPPELVLTNQIALNLTPDQVNTIKKQVNETHGKVLDVQVDLHRITEQLHLALAAPKVDESAVLSLASQAMDLEKQVKTAHLSLMIRVKNVLTPDQQDKARSLQPYPYKVNRKMRSDAPPEERN